MPFQQVIVSSQIQTKIKYGLRELHKLGAMCLAEGVIDYVMC